MSGAGGERGEVDAVWVTTLSARLRGHYGVLDDDDARAEVVDRLVRLRRVLEGAGSERLRVGTELARGGMGVVHTAHDAALQRDVATKRTLSDPSAGPGEREVARARLLREAEIMAALDHPGVVPVFDVGLDADGEPFFSMPKVDGETFGNVLAVADPDGHDWPLARRVDVLRRVAETVAHAHARGILHRDLKPANILLGPHGAVYVTDWGLAFRLGGADPEPRDAPRDGASADVRLTGAGGVLGTPAYMPPEQAAGIGVPTPRADVYALGAILYEILAGAAPYAGERSVWSASEILEAIRTRPPRELEGSLPRDLVAICDLAMAREPECRYPSVEAFAADLRAWSEGRIVFPAERSLVERAGAWLRRHPDVRNTIAVACGLLLIVSAWFVLAVTRARDEAETRLAEIEDLAVVERITSLRGRADMLWPARPEAVADLEGWLREADSIRAAAEALRVHRAAVAESVDRADVQDDVTLWRLRALDEALAEHVAFFAPVAAEPELPLGTGFGDVQRRLAHARRPEPAPGRGDADLWRDAGVPRQRGLVPLGRDPVSGLHEFAFVPSGDVPRRLGGRPIVPTREAAITFVLVPGGEFVMGADRAGGLQVDPWSEEINEAPAHRVRLEPFFVSKWEMTQAQWRTLTARSPSVHDERSAFVEAGAADLHPVESVSWIDAREVLRKHGLALPTEAQWEYVARAGTSTPWTFGATPEDLLDPPAGNLADANSAATRGSQSWAATPGLDDGFVMHAPVGSFRPNAFGLFDTLGNVKEWCRGDYVSYATDPRSGDGLRGDPEAIPGTAMYRGGGFDESAMEARSANRAGLAPALWSFSIGIRPVRGVE